MVGVTGSNPVPPTTSRQVEKQGLERKAPPARGFFCGRRAEPASGLISSCRPTSHVPIAEPARCAGLCLGNRHGLQDLTTPAGRAEPRLAASGDAAALPDPCPAGFAGGGRQAGVPEEPSGEGASPTPLGAAWPIVR